MDTLLLAIAIAATIMVPGLVFRRFKARFLVLSDAPSEQIALLEIAISGLLINTLVFPVYFALGADPLRILWKAVSAVEFYDALRANPLGIVLHCFVLPAAAAMMLAFLERKHWITTGLARLGLQPSETHPSAWSAGFLAHRDRAALCRVTLKDGSVVYGRFGVNAAATLSGVTKDVYFDQTYDLVDGGLTLTEGTSGMLVAGDLVALIEFKDLPDFDGDEDEQTETGDVVDTETEDAEQAHG